MKETLKGGRLRMVFYFKRNEKMLTVGKIPK